MYFNDKFYILTHVSYVEVFTKFFLNASILIKRSDSMTMNNYNEKEVILNNGVKMPILGLVCIRFRRKIRNKR